MIGRIDDQIKIDGYRVELGEIEEEPAQSMASRQRTPAWWGAMAFVRWGSSWRGLQTSVNWRPSWPHACRATWCPPFLFAGTCRCPLRAR